MLEPIATIKERLQQVLTETGIKPIELSKMTGIPKASISQYLSGYVEPKQDRIYLIAQALRISEAWLIGYDVPMRKSEFSTITVAPHILKYLELYQNLTEQQQSLVKQTIETFSVSNKGGDSE